MMKTLERLEKAEELALETTIILREVLKMDPCKCQKYAIEQLRIARRFARELVVILDKVMCNYVETDLDTAFLQEVVFPHQRMSTVIDGITIILDNGFCAPAEELCEVEKVFRRVLLDAEMATHDLYTVIRLMTTV